MGFAQLSPVLSRREQREDGDAASVYPDFRVSHLTDELDLASTGGPRCQSSP